MNEKQKIAPFFTPIFRALYPSLFEMKTFTNRDGTQDSRYRITMLFDKKTTDLDAIKRFMFAHIVKAWPDKNLRPKGIRRPLEDGDIKYNEDPSKFSVYKGCWAAKASTRRRVGVVDAQNLPVTDPKEIYSGCYCRALLSAYTYDKAGNRGLAFSLDAVQKVRDGKPIEGVDAVAAFKNAPVISDNELPEDAFEMAETEMDAF
jgi:hypothetical protein